MTASITEINVTRWASLRRYRLLEPDSASSFKTVVDIAASLCDVPIATLSFNDRTRERFAACHGCTLEKIPCEKGFSEYVIHGRSSLLVNDTRADPRFPRAPLLEAMPDVRFYAAVPVFAEDGVPLGTLAVMDRMVRHLPVAKLEALEALGAQVMSLIQGERRKEAGKNAMPPILASPPPFDAFFKAMPGLHWVIEPESLRVVSVSGKVLEKLGKPVEQVIGLPLPEVLQAGRKDPETREGARVFVASMRRVLNTGKSDTIIAQRYPIPAKETAAGSLQMRYWNVVSAPVMDESGKPVFVVASASDVSEMVELREREGKAVEDRRELETRATRMAKDMMHRAREIERLNEHLYMAQSMAHVGSWELSPDAPNYWSAEAFEILGLETRQAPDEDILLDAVHPDDRDVMLAHRKEVQENGRQVELKHRIVRPDGSVRHVRQQMRPGVTGIGTLYGTLQDITQQKQVEDELHARVRQQEAVARFGQKALNGVRLEDLLEEAVDLVANEFDVEYCKVLQLLPDGKTMRLVAGRGWRKGLVGRATVGIGRDSQAGYTLMQKHSVIVEDLRSDTRFNGPPLLRDHGVISGISVIIEGEHRPWGALGAHSTRARKFTQEDINFFESIANIIGEVAYLREVADSYEARTRKLDALLQISRKAMSGCARKALQNYVCEQVAAVLNTEYVLMAECLEDGSGRKVIAGVGWKEGVINHAILSTTKGSQGAFILASSKPVVMEDLPVEPRFRPTAMLLEHGVDSGIAAAIRDREGKPLGTLSVYTSERRRFTTEEAEFMEQVTDMLAEVQAKPPTSTTAANLAANARSIENARAGTSTETS